jgi:hypothetical protein
MSQPTVEQTQELFEWLTNGEFERFLSNCAENLVLSFRGADPATTYVSKSEIPDWYESLQSLTGAPVYAEAEVAQVAGTKSIVLLRHEFVRDGVDHTFVIVNACSFRESLLAAWSAYPLNLPDYAQALGITRSAVSQLA